MSIVKNPLVVICIFLWLGFLGGISFLEAWLKFRAPGITLPLGLGIGKLVFNALNKIEWILCLSILFSTLISKEKLFKRDYIMFLIPMGLLILQTIWLLPALDFRAEQIIQGISVPDSNLHFYYVIAEGVKVIFLSIFGVLQFKKQAP